ncbi:LAFE_0H07470g1_1 [Lachancea fermentati]|uniref:Diphthine--ammonia ligase n=1 Tax=Lachancea fermentati TaxID=4955 RepID=A0A1G4MJV9_LACFM|nr:LAFE_0H07470g1_1 [Lachancea fermentati]
MKFIALVSGGKDSCYSILHSIRQGHEIVALANLHPIDENEQELDSFMFQTVGHDIVSLYEKCTGLPMFRRPIKPQGSKNISLNYSPTRDDEIEDLYELLKEAKKQMPEIEAVNAGAILSSYQRTRVEDVCRRLNLISLSYLWQRDQYELMSEMCTMSKVTDETLEPKMDARIIKVAAAGLDDRHLGKSLPKIFPILQRLNSMYEVHICGEGGEFETLVLDAPFFVNGYLRVIGQNIGTSEGNAGVYSTCLEVEVVERQTTQPVEALIRELPVPPLLEEPWELLRKKLLEDHYELPRDGNILKGNDITSPRTCVEAIGRNLHISNLRPLQGSCLDEKCRDVFAQLERILSERHLTRSQILASTLILSNIENFAAVNENYNNFFDVSNMGPLPPSRSCVESNLLGENSPLQLSVIVDNSHKLIKEGKILTNDNKDGLHVQGRSYWAPCNIGPYSQAIWVKNDVNSVCYISGQISLIPSTMSMPDKVDFLSDAIFQSVLSLRHFHTLKETIGARHQLSMICYISHDSMPAVVARTWAQYCESLATCWEHDGESCQAETSLLLIVKVSNLPRGALCEWGGIACRREDYVDEDEDEDDNHIGQRNGKIIEADDSHVSYDDVKLAYKTLVTRGSEIRQYITMFLDSTEHLCELIEKHNSRHIVLYYNPNSTPSCQDITNVEHNPVEKVYDSDGNRRLLALQINS